MATDIAQPRPFRVSIPDKDVQRMKKLIELTPLPERDILSDIAPWENGTDLTWLKGMRDEWLHNFDWKKVEEDMNRWPQFQVDIEGMTIHFVHVRSEDPDAIPLLITHGWPGSFYEFHNIIEPLVRPPAGQQAFHVVAPSLPGFGFSSAPTSKKWSIFDAARYFDTLMTGVLGYEAYAAQGGDFGAVVSSRLGTWRHPACKAVHLNMCTVGPPKGTILTYLLSFAMPSSLWGSLSRWKWTEAEREDLARTKWFWSNYPGYFAQQATAPFTIGLAIQGSPIGLLSWIGEKYIAVSDPEKLNDIRQHILATVSLYYLTSTFSSSTIPYKEVLRLAPAPPESITKPMAFSSFKYDINVPPTSWIKAFHNIVVRKRHEQGGHFPALDNPEALIQDIREFMTEQKDNFDDDE